MKTKATWFIIGLITFPVAVAIAAIIHDYVL